MNKLGNWLTQHRTVLIIFTLVLQTITTAQMLSNLNAYETRSA